MALGPAYLRSGARLVFWPWRTAGASEVVYRIAVEPGNVTIARGADLAVSAALVGFSSDSATVSVRRGAATTWETIAMTPSTRTGQYTVRVFDIDSTSEYIVEADGIRSPIFSIAVVDRPYVKSLALDYRFPAYTGLAPETVDDGGDIAAVRGTTVLVRATPTMATRGGRLVLEGGDTVALTLDSAGTLSGALRVNKAGFYRVELLAADGTMVPGSLDYVIDVLPDRPPTVRIAEPGRDVKVTRLEEVFASVEAEDDYGVAKVDLVYSVNGAPEQTSRCTARPPGARPR
jgi:hypothetical protein